MSFHPSCQKLSYDHLQMLLGFALRRGGIYGKDRSSTLFSAVKSYVTCTFNLSCQFYLSTFTSTKMVFTSIYDNEESKVTENEMPLFIDSISFFCRCLIHQMCSLSRCRLRMLKRSLTTLAHWTFYPGPLMLG